MSGVQLIAACTFVFMGGHAMAVTYYVNSSTGNDAYRALTKNAPWKTISRAASVMVGGDTAIVASGTYPERVTVTRSGSSGRRIVYRASGRAVTRGFTIRADHIVVEGFEITNTPNDSTNGDGVHVQGRYCTVSGNYLHDITREGIYVGSKNFDDPRVSNNLIRNNRIVRAGRAGIRITGRNSIVEGNDVSHTLQYPPTWTHPPSSGMDADGIRFFGSGHIIRRNYIHDILTSDPGNVDPHIDCFQTWGPARDIVIEQNLCINRNDGHQGIMIRPVGTGFNNIVVRNNVIESFRCLNVYRCSNLRFVNNLCIGGLSYKGTSGYAAEVKECTNALVMNNVFYNISKSYPYLYHRNDPGLQVGYNLVYMNNGRKPTSSPYIPRPTDLWQVDPRLGNVYDLRIHGDSPLIDRGRAIRGLIDDYHGNPRPYGAGYDIGPFEFCVPIIRNPRGR